MYEVKKPGRVANALNLVPSLKIHGFKPLVSPLSSCGCLIEHKEKIFYVGLISVHNGSYLAPFIPYIKQYNSTTTTVIKTIWLHFY
jgi:hypothetical protein